MSAHSSSQKWAIAVRIFHWFGAFILLAAYFTVEISRNIGIHKAIGVSFLLWTVARLINRFLVKAPPAPPMPKWQTGIAHTTHAGLYFAMLAMPISGLLMSMYSGFPTKVFGLFTIPVLVTPDDEKAMMLNNLHTNIWWWMLLILFALHIGGALYHQFVQKDGLIKRMF